MLKTALAIRHIGFEDLGYFEAPLVEAGYAVRYVDAGADDLTGIDAREPALLIILGGPMGVYEQDRYPFLADELRIVRDRLAAHQPMLGICLGAQLIAHALGARVYPGARKEIGFAPVRLTAAGKASPLASLARGQPVLHWHGDTFDLPAGATLLASTDLYINQAFAVGDRVLAVQFHLEAGDDIEPWLNGHADELASAGIDPERIRLDAANYGRLLRVISCGILAEWLCFDQQL